MHPKLNIITKMAHKRNKRPREGLKEATDQYSNKGIKKINSIIIKVTTLAVFYIRKEKREN